MKGRSQHTVLTADRQDQACIIRCVYAMNLCDLLKETQGSVFTSSP